eukprot:2311430-Pyramimonas_sp.AAC.1
MSSEGWKLRLSGAYQTPQDGASAGVGIAVKHHVGVGGAVEHHRHLIHAPSSTVWVNGCVRGGFYLII